MEQANTAILAAQTEITAAKADWEGPVKVQRDAHAEVLRTLHEEGLEPDKYLDTMKALDDLRRKNRASPVTTRP